MRDCDLVIYSRQRPIQHIDAGKTLRIPDDRRFDIVWTADGWNTTRSAASQAFGSAGFSADSVPPANCTVLEWTLHWTEADAWLGYNVKVEVDADA